MKDLSSMGTFYKEHARTFVMIIFPLVRPCIRKLSSYVSTLLCSSLLGDVADVIIRHVDLSNIPKYSYTQVNDMVVPTTLLNVFFTILTFHLTGHDS